LGQLTRFSQVWQHKFILAFLDGWHGLGGWTMRLIRFALAALLILFVAGSFFAQQPQQGQGRGQGRQGQVQPEQQVPVPPSDYTTYVSREDFFSVHVPCKFATRDITWLSEYENPLPGRVYSCNRGQESYSMTVINYTDVVKIHEAREHTDAATGGGAGAYARIDVYASVAYAATKLRQKAAKVTFDAWHYIDLIPGHQLQFTNADGTRTFAGIYLHAYRLYILEATAPATAPPPGLFQQSLSILNAEGERVRYRTIYNHPW
jgi:hypothetical protein